MAPVEAYESCERTSLCTFGHGKGAEPRKSVSQEAGREETGGGRQSTELKGNAPIKTVAALFVVSGSCKGKRL